VWKMDTCPDNQSADSFNCAGSGSELAADDASPYTHDVTAAAGEKLCFYCGKELHCENGWYLVVDVEAAEAKPECHEMDQSTCDKAIADKKCIKSVINGPCQTPPTKEECEEIVRNPEGCRKRGCNSKNRRVCELPAKEEEKPTPPAGGDDDVVVAEGNTDCSTLSWNVCKTAEKKLKVNCKLVKLAGLKSCQGDGSSLGGGDSSDPCSTNKPKKSKCKGTCEIVDGQCVTATSTPTVSCADVASPNKKNCKKAKCKFQKAKGNRAARCKDKK